MARRVRGAIFGVVAVVAASGIAVPGVGHSAVGGSYATEIPPNSKVRITYEGAFQGVAVVRDRSRDSRVTFGGVKLNFDGTREVPLQGTYRVVVNYDGALVSGVETQSSSVQGLSGVFKFQGQRVGSNCMLTFDTGQQATANCTETEFSYNTNTQTVHGEPLRLRFEGRVISRVDVVEEARLKAEAKAKADREAAAKVAETRRNMDDRLAWAGSGDPVAMNLVASYYRDGKEGFPRDPKQAVHWYTRAAKAGDAISAGDLAYMYATGTGVERNAAKSHGYWLQCASGRQAKSPVLPSATISAREDVITSCMQIAARDFELGRGVLRDDAQALVWYRRCAKRGDDECIAWMNDRGVN
jgi:Sel1 repeat